MNPALFVSGFQDVNKQIFFLKKFFFMMEGSGSTPDSSNVGIDGEWAIYHRKIHQYTGLRWDCHLLARIPISEKFTA
jgi:hypothetical protein